MPLNPQDTNINGVQDRRASSPRRETDITKSKSIVVTKAVYDALVRGEALDQNIKVRRLCKLRNAIGNALTLATNCATDHNPDTKSNGGKNKSDTYNALRQIHRNLERSYLKFPLEIKNK